MAKLKTTVRHDTIDITGIDSDIWQTASFSGIDCQTCNSSIAVYNGNKYDLIGRQKCVSLHDRKSPDHDD